LFYFSAHYTVALRPNVTPSRQRALRLFCRQRFATLVHTLPAQLRAQRKRAALSKLVRFSRRRTCTTRAA